jgi:hypothetical protein
MSKHLLIGGLAVLLALISLALGVTAGDAGEAVAPSEATKAMLGAHVISAERALQPLVPALASDAATNPFTMKRAEIRTTRLSFPPPPPLALPALPILPLAER